MVLEQFGSIQLIFSKAQAATTPVYQNAQSQNLLQLFFFFFCAEYFFLEI